MRLGPARFLAGTLALGALLGAIAVGLALVWGSP